jgi:hypothetical protein
VVANSQRVIGGNEYYYAKRDIVTRISSWGYYLIYSPAKKESTGKKFQELCRCVTYPSSSKFFLPLEWQVENMPKTLDKLQCMTELNHKYQSYKNS